MAIDIIARGLAASIVGSDGKIANDKMPVLGAVPAGTTFYPVGQLSDSSLVAGKTAEEILLMMLYGIVSPTLTNPRLSIALNDDNDALIIGRPTTLKGALSFDRGSISPAFGTSGYRAGAPINYTIGNTQIESAQDVCDFEIVVTPTESKVNLLYAVEYGAGEQPVNSIGQPFGAALPAGALYESIELTAAHALYDAYGDNVEFDWFVADDGQGYYSAFASEGSGKQQTFAVAEDVSVVGIKAYNLLTQTWEWLGGSARTSLTHFDTTLISGESLGETQNYVLYTHNQPASGERELRIYVL